jgi:hypothetical protein
MPQEDHSACKLNHPEEILWVVLPTNDDATVIMEPSKQTLDFPATTVAPQHAAILRCGSGSLSVVRRDHLYTETLADLRIQWITVVGAVTDQPLGSLGEEASLDGEFDEFCFMRRSAGHVHGERKTMAVCDCHDFAAFAAFCRADTRAPFFAELKLASMKASLRSSFPRSRKSSASFCSSLVSSPERCHCWKRR